MLAQFGNRTERSRFIEQVGILLVIESGNSLWTIWTFPGHRPPPQLDPVK